jgi:hypothetical protein
LAIHRDDDIEATDGHMGVIEELRIDPRNYIITQLVLRDGHLWNTRHVPIPISEVEHVADGTIYLKLTKAEISQLDIEPHQT